MSRKSVLINHAKEILQEKGHVVVKFKHYDHVVTYECARCRAALKINAKPKPPFEKTFEGAAYFEHCDAQLKFEGVGA
jgi:hypothetical protein